MIPKIIHYCWFGGNPLPESAQQCIQSWKRLMPDYEIKEWNETNFDVHCCEYVEQAYEEGNVQRSALFARQQFIALYGNFALILSYFRK